MRRLPLLLFVVLIPTSLTAQFRSPTLSRLAPAATATPMAWDAVQVAWTPVTNAADYRVFRGVDPNGPFVSLGVVPATQTSLRDGGLVPGTAFHYRIEATDPAAATTLRSTRTAAPLAVLTASAGTPAAPAPTGLQRCPVQSGCLFSWQPVTGAVAYAVYDHYLDPVGPACRYGNRRLVYTPQSISTGKGACSESYQVAAIFEMRDFPVPGNTFRAEGPRATITP